MNELSILARKANNISNESSKLAGKLYEVLAKINYNSATSHDDFLNLLTIFLLACIVGYYVVWKVTPALHTPLMSVTNAVSGIIVVGAITVTGFEEFDAGTIFGALAIFIASINIFGGFVVTFRMLKMFEKK